MSRFAILLLWLLPTALQAAVFKCISPDGHHSYQDQPCPLGHATHTLQASYFSQVSRESYPQQPLSRQQQVQHDKRLQQLQRKEQQLRIRQRQLALKNCQRLQRRQQVLHAQLLASRSARQTQRLQARLVSQQQALQDAACIP
ncbi:hypothetical protein DLM_0038 [Aquitalea magnusonii]|uniref:DUF4124 domain-containing protein n=1 Tax=Aquitalea magnusonii TaxID=332411 RepID=A0A3G9GDR2_9NEIS|nr:DUF4124 domain-containing protein [Aquitalea magnusonii]BBF83726.1 hypothetical protein DLM_0038 [Aquitalea magnusonii]